MRAPTFLFLAMLVTFMVIIWRGVLPDDVKAEVTAFVKRHWWVPGIVFAMLGALVSALAMFPIKTF